MEDKIQELHDAFVSATKKTFSEMAFVDVTESTRPSDELTYSHIIYQTFLEPQRGECALFMPTGCKKMIVENIYGEDWNTLNPDQTDDCLLELCNVLAGNFLINLYGADAHRDMSVPQLLFDEAHLTHGKNTIKYHFYAEEIPFKTHLTIET